MQSAKLIVFVHLEERLLVYFARFNLQEKQQVHFEVLLTVHLSIFILVINQLDAQNLFYRCTCVHRTATYRCGDTRCCIIQFSPPDDEQMVLETCRGMK